MSHTTRPTLRSVNGMVSSPHYLASIAGMDILKAGGTAVDAAIAINSTLGVVYPHMTGMGGDSFWLIYDQSQNKVNALNGTGRSIAAINRDYYTGSKCEAIPMRGPESAITVPGTVDAWCRAHSRFGKLTLAQILSPAIGYARDGYPVSAGQNRFTEQTAEVLKQNAATADIFMPNGKAPATGDILRLPALANTMEAIAKQGREGFYTGAVAEEIVRAMNAAGVPWQLSDLSEHAGIWGEPISTEYRGYTCYQHPPNSQGFAHLMILNILEQFDIQPLGDESEEYLHLVVEATKLAFRDRDRYLTCPEACDVPLDKLLSKEYAKELAAEISDHAKKPTAKPMGQDTTCTVVVDRWGNAVSIIQSIYHEFGSGFVAGDTGLLLQNRGSFFSLDPDHVNCLEPGKRCFHTLMPGMLFKDGKLDLVYGTMGGEGQPQTSTMLVSRYVDFQQDIQQMIDRPRWLYGRTWGAETHSLRVESRFAPEVIEALKQRGHDVEVVEPWCDLTGHAAAIQVNDQSRVLSGGADPRGEGIAAGW